MSWDKVPSRVQVLAWGPQQLADYLRRMDLSGCDKTVLRNSMGGARFVNLTESDLQKFPQLHAPMISKISREIRKKDEKKGLFRKVMSRAQVPESSAEGQGWAEDEFDDEDFDDDDDDYENPDSGEDGSSADDYETPSEDVDAANDYEPPPSEPAEDPHLAPCPALSIADGDYIDKRDGHASSRGLPPVVCPRPSGSKLTPPSLPTPGDSASRRDASPRGTVAREPPPIFRARKPGKESGGNMSPVRGSQRNTPVAQLRKPQPDVQDPPVWSKPPVLPPPSSSSVSRSNSSARPPPNRLDARREASQTHGDEAPKHNTFPLQSKSLLPRPGLPERPRPGDSLPPGLSGSLPHKLKSAFATQRGSVVGSERSSFCPPTTASHTPTLDPCWYVGKVTRGQAEQCLKQVHRDGAYLVRDSTRQMVNQPFTLMVFYQDKVYNVQIRLQNQKFLLGTGLKVQELFPSVSDIIAHYSQSPLLLINAKNRGSDQQNQCLLSSPAGFHMTRQNWS